MECDMVIGIEVPRGNELFERLKSEGYYPYTDLDRKPVL
jgi:hypothetical protein